MMSSAIDSLYRNIQISVTITSNFSGRDLDEAVQNVPPLYIIASLIKLKVEELQGFLKKGISQTSKLLVNHSIEVIKWDEDVRELRQLINVNRKKNERLHAAIKNNLEKDSANKQTIDDFKSSLEDAKKGRSEIHKKLQDNEKVLKGIKS